jgi:hypothetical protein
MCCFARCSSAAAPLLKKAEEAQNELSFHTTQNAVCFFQFF